MKSLHRISKRINKIYFLDNLKTSNNLIPIRRIMATSNINIEDFSIITEGKASILFPKDNAVFYNKVQQFNRDMSVAAIRTWSEIFLEEKEKKARKTKGASTTIAQSKNGSFTILEALAASGLRSIRYAKEIPNIDFIVVNDLDADAVNSINKNVEYNGLSKELVRANQGDAW
jgi:tRNA (guanine26-N2/guanine27-N2)-dimethyltransferase